MTRSITASIIWISMAAVVCAAPAPDSPRLARAKDYIADEQWGRAVVELQAAVNDQKERNRDEALYWLAESEHEVGDQAAAIQTIARIEREYPSSRWVYPARSLQIEIAQRLQRDDLLWVIAAPTAPPPPATRPTPAPPMPARAVAPVAVPAAPPSALTLAMPAPPAPAPVPMPRAAPPARAVVPPAALEFWTPGSPDTDLRIEALGGLIDAHAARVVPLLKDIALDPSQPAEARRAVFVLAQSPQPEAQQTVVEIAKSGTGPARVAAIRELGRMNTPGVTLQLMQVYDAADSPTLKRQVVTSLGERADTSALLRIATTEPNALVRDSAILTLGRASARMQLRTLYLRSDSAARPVVLSALFNAKDDDGLIQIARTEKDPGLRLRARQQLRILATPKAVAFLDEQAPR